MSVMVHINKEMSGDVQTASVKEGIILGIGKVTQNYECYGEHE